MDHRDLATELLKTARAAGADSADVLVAEGTEFSVTVRKGEVETLTEAGSKALGVRVFVGKRTATTYTSDFSWLDAATARRGDGRHGAGHRGGRGGRAPRRDGPARRTWSSGSSTPRRRRCRRTSGSRARDGRRRRRSRRRGSSTRRARRGAQGESSVVLANTMGFLGGYRTSSVSLSVVPQAERDGQMERDYWYTAGRGLADLEPPEQVGRTAAERTLRRLGARQVPTGEVPVVFDPETAAEILEHALLRDLGLRRLPQRHVPEGPPRRGGGLAAPHPRGRRPARPRSGLAAVRRRGAAHPPERAGRARGAPALAVRLVLGAQDRGAADGLGPARGGRRPVRRGGEPLLRAGDVLTGRDRRRSRRAGSTSPTSSASA